MVRHLAPCVLLVCSVSACGPDVSGLEDVGTVEVTFDLEPAAEAGFSVDAAVITFTHRDTQEDLTVQVDVSNGTATAELQLRPGGWDITVLLAEGGQVVGEGTGTATVLSGFVTAVVIEIELDTGGVIVEIKWNTDFHGVIADISKNPVTVEIDGIGVFSVHGLSRIGWDIELIESPTTGGRTHKDPGAVAFPDVVMLNLTSNQSEAEALADWITTDRVPRAIRVVGLRGLGGESTDFIMFEPVPVDGDPSITQSGQQFTVAGVRLGDISRIDLLDYRFYESECAAPGHIVEIDGAGTLPCYPEGVLDLPAVGTSDPLHLPSIREGGQAFAWAEGFRQDAEVLGCAGCGVRSRSSVAVLTIDANADETQRIHMFETWAHSFTLFKPASDYRKRYLFEMTLATDNVETAQ